MSILDESQTLFQDSSVVKTPIDSSAEAELTTEHGGELSSKGRKAEGTDALGSIETQTIGGDVQELFGIEL